MPTVPDEESVGETAACIAVGMLTASNMANTGFCRDAGESPAAKGGAVP